ncbi:MAG: hypothetical protein LBL60_01380 [Mycoplasmataceae bacterium]|jgi:hypothetical protein|nr:hypothetical protein [Mycoplasmataceae bacterium]
MNDKTIEKRVHVRHEIEGLKWHPVDKKKKNSIQVTFKVSGRERVFLERKTSEYGATNISNLVKNLVLDWMEMVEDEEYKNS